MTDKELPEIDILANELAKSCPNLVYDCCGNTTCCACIANDLYEVGYRKADEVRKKTAKEIFNKLIKITEDEFKGSLPFGVLKAWALEYGVEVEENDRNNDNIKA